MFVCVTNGLSGLYCLLVVECYALMASVRGKAGYVCACALEVDVRWTKCTRQRGVWRMRIGGGRTYV